jgi:hypothetical protein
MKIHSCTRIFNNCFPKIVPFVIKCLKMRWSQRGPTWQYARRVACWISKATCAYTHQRQCTHTHTQTRERTSMLSHTDTKIRNTYCFSTATTVSWTLLNVTSCKYCFSFFPSRNRLPSGKTQEKCYKLFSFDLHIYCMYNHTSHATALVILLVACFEDAQTEANSVAQSSCWG